MMNDDRKSDRPVVPTKVWNKAGKPVADMLEGRSLAKGNTGQPTAARTQSRTPASSGLERVRGAARRDREMRFTALLHHVSVDALRAAFLGLKRTAAPGVDGQTWHPYRQGLELRLQDLHERVQRGTFRAKPTRRSYIPKADGRQRPLGVASLEDKIVQSAVVDVMNRIYEVDFLGFSYGFRPGRGPHQALDALMAGLRRKVNWVLDADIRGFFDAIDHGWLMRFIEHRIADKRLLRLIRKWLRAGVVEDGVWSATEKGTPQGATLSPLLANVYLHYALDLWVHQWRGRHARGEVIVVRYADDFVVGFQHQADAERFKSDLQHRLRQFSLTLHPEKTRLIEFGRFAAENRTKRGSGKPETFDFLGFTHVCGKNGRGWFQVKRRTVRKRVRASLAELKVELLRRRHRAIPEQGRWLSRVLRGHYAYYAVPGNIHAMGQFRTQIERLWRRALGRRSQRATINWERMRRLSRRWLPSATIQHPWPEERFHANTQGRSPVR